MMNSVSRKMLIDIIQKLSRNHVHQITALETPWFFKVSFNLSSFSKTMPLTVMETEKIHASTMKIGKQRFRMIIKLKQREKRRVTERSLHAGSAGVFV